LTTLEKILGFAFLLADITDVFVFFNNYSALFLLLQTYLSTASEYVLFYPTFTGNLGGSFFIGTSSSYLIT
jgi:hypothetical protein